MEGTCVEDPSLLGLGLALSEAKIIMAYGTHSEC